MAKESDDKKHIVEFTWTVCDDKGLVKTGTLRASNARGAMKQLLAMPESKPVAEQGVTNEVIRHINPVAGSALIKGNGKSYLSVDHQPSTHPLQTLYLDDFVRQDLAELRKDGSVP